MGKSRRPWGGGGVVIAKDRPRREPGGREFYPEPRYVVTNYVNELTSLFEHLRDIFGHTLNGVTKTEFYGRLANAANDYALHEGDHSAPPTGLLLAVVSEAELMRSEMGQGTFEALDILLGTQ